MKKKLFIPYIYILCCLFPYLSYAQEKVADSTIVRQDYSLPDPIKYEAVYDVNTNMYYLYPKIGNTIVGSPIAMTPEEYNDYILSNIRAEYLKEKSELNDLLYRKDQTDAEKKGLLPSLTIKNKIFETIFGGNKIEIIPQGFASFDLGGLYQKIDNPLILPQNRTSFAFNIQQRIQLGLLGKVGENLSLKANYDTQSGFAFENRMNLVWQAKGTWKDLQNKGLNEIKDGVKVPSNGGGEDKIIKKVEFGNVSMPLSTSLIRGSQSLFGLKTEFQLGKTYGTMVFSQQQGEARNIVVQGGGAISTFKVSASDYEDNQHYYLGHYFLDNYDSALENYPLINSDISISRIEVWVLDQGSGNLSDQKSIIGIRDLGEGLSGYPDNTQNDLYKKITDLGSGLREVSTAYNTINGQSLPNASNTNETYKDGEQFIYNRKARRLSSSEYTLQSQLGYISLNQRLNDNQLLAVSYSYTVNGSSTVYKVGEFSDESAVLITKLLKPNTTVKTTSPMWSLMMKNIYSLEANQISEDNFLLNVYYKDPQNGRVNYLPGTNIEDKILLKALNWDRLNMNNDLQTNSNGELGDGVFDFLEGVTINSSDGKVIFTKAQPFGSYLQGVLGSNDPNFVYTELYTQQKATASQSNLANRYTLEGRYKGSQGSGISLGAINVPQGSVTVTANGVQLVEGQDYTVDYMLGTVNIINEAVKQSGQAINISLENQLIFNTQRKRFLGLNLERKFNDNLFIGGTVVNYSETPLTQKVNYGQEAVNNTMFGMNLMYNNELPALTRLTNKIPLVKTEAPSNISFKVEGAYLLPGQNSGMDGQSYIDDFEQTTSKISLKDPASWVLASKPEKNTNDPIFADAGSQNDITNGYGRGLISWYNIDPRFYGLGGNAPSGISAASLSNHASRRVQTRELYNSRDFVAGEQTIMNTFDITYYPKDRGPYNVNPAQESTQERWAGLMRPISVSNFTNSNIEYVEFWMMDPYADGNSLGSAPKLLLHLGNVTEDVLKDGMMQYENGLPTTATSVTTTETNWGTQPKQFPLLYAFSTDGNERYEQDLGYDGIDDEEEAVKFNSNNVNPVTQTSDPASDNFLFYLSDKFTGAQASSLPERYKYFRNPDGNSNPNSLEVSSQTPDSEDANRDYNMDQSENYLQYTINLDPANMVLNQNYIVDEKEVDITFQNGQAGKSKWYLFRIPVSDYEVNAGDADPSILNNVRYARLILEGFDETSTLRFGTFDLIRSDWRTYTKNIAVDDNDITEEGTQDVNDPKFAVGSVNLEENGLGTPPYVLPPGISRQVLSGSSGAQRQNEASLYMEAMELNDDARGVFKNTNLDMRRYKKLKLFVHAEDVMTPAGSSLYDENAKFFIRFGSDATDNYYEYEASLKYTPTNATSPLEIWPDENTVDFKLEDFINLKQTRDQDSGASMDERYEKQVVEGDDNKMIYVKGRPSLGSVTTMMIGVRNTTATNKNIVLWIDEIRLSEIENEGGYAANASLSFNLGDFAMVNANAAYASAGFGSIEQTPSERSQATNSAFNINTTVNVDKFLPEKSGVKIPLNYSYTQTIEDPKYNPIDNDVEFAKAANKEELKKVARTYTQQRSVGVVNMHKERTNSQRKARFYDIENISVTAVYNDDYYRDIYTKRDYRQYLRGNIDYNYQFKPWILRPLNKVVSDTAKSYKYLRWAKELNFNVIPTRISFRTEIDRNYNEFQYRNIESLLSGNAGEDFDMIKNRAFYFGWNYNLGFNFTKSLKLEINSFTRTLNDNINPETMDTGSIFGNPFRSGRPVLYEHNVQLNYRLPFQYFPYLDFINAELGYGFRYNWTTRSTALLQSAEGNLGNISQNTNTIVVAGSLDMPKFFGQFKFFQGIDETLQKRRKEIDSLGTVYTKAFEKKNGKKPGFFSFKSYKFKNKLTPLQAIGYALTSVKQFNINYNENNGTVLPGIISSPNFYGYGQNIGGPTVGFLLGSQADIRLKAIENGWIDKDVSLYQDYYQQKNRNLTGDLQIQPINDFRISVSFMKRYSEVFNQSGFNFDVDNTTNAFDFAYGNELTTHSRSNWMLKTSFKDGAEIFKNLIRNTRTVSQMLGTNPNASGYTDGYSMSNSYVLIPAFQAAVTGKSPKALGDPKKSGFPVPNWNVTYSGLKNIPFINSQFSKFDILHSYTSTYTMTGIQSNIDYYNINSTGVDLDINNDFINPYVFSNVAYVEQFAPLIGVDMTLRNNMQIRAQYNRDRMFLLGLVNNTITEDSGNEFIFGFGYIIKDLKLKLNYQGKSKNIVSDLNIRGDVSVRDNITRIANITPDEDTDAQVTGGQKLIGIKFTADYNMSQNLNLSLFYDQLVTKYKISTAFPLSTVRAGIRATFTFGGSN